MQQERLIYTCYKIVRPDGSHEAGDVTWPAQPSYDRLKFFVEPIVQGNLEHVTVLDDFAGGTNYVRSDMFVNEDGHLLHLPRNVIATRIYRRNWLLRHPGTDPESIPFIVGPAILFDRRVWF
jgi:hypothetical protein